MVLPLIPKPQGGHRPALLEAGLIRLWERLGRPQVHSFLEATGRQCWASAQGRAIENSVWLHACSAEATAVDGGASAGVSTDGRTCGAQSNLELECRMRKHDVPSVHVKVLTNVCRYPRVVKFVNV